MTKITIHGQKMQYHKVTAISVTLIPGEGGTATFFPETGTSYTLSSLPIGSKIAKAASSLYVITNSSGTTLGSISLSESPGYEISDCDIFRQGMHIAISNTTLEDGDIIEAVFKASTKQIQFYLGWVAQAYGDPWDYARLFYNGQPLNPNVPYIEVQNSRNLVELSIPSGGLDSTFKFYESMSPSLYDKLLAEISDPTYNYRISYIEYYDADTGTTYTCDGTSPVIGNVGDMGMARIFLDTASSCTLADYQTAGLPNPYALDTAIISAVRDKISAIQEMNLITPNEFDYVLMDQDGIYGFGLYNCTYRTIDPQSGSAHYINSQIYVAFYQHSGNLVAMPYERTQASQYQEMPLWAETHLTTPDNYINGVFANGDNYLLNNWMQDWSCGDTCDLIHTIYDLAEYNI